MIKKTRICDRCGNEYGYYDDQRKFRLIYERAVIRNSYEREMDLCPKCNADLIAWMNVIKDAEREVEE